jgi:hypothetical protein
MLDQLSIHPEFDPRDTTVTSGGAEQLHPVCGDLLCF